MRHNELSLWYLNSYICKEKKRLELNREHTFDNFELKVKICDDYGNHINYLEAADFKRTLILGGRGSGKTYVLKRIFKSNLCRGSNYYMYFDLRDYNGEGLLNLICRRIKCRDLTKGIIKKLLYNGEIAFIFDNYDDMDFKSKNIIKEKIFNNEKLSNVRFIVASRERINDIEFDKIYHLESLSTREVYKKIVRNYFDDSDEFKEFKLHLQKNKLECILYRPLNLNYLLRIIEKTCSISFVYDLKSENDLYEKYINEVIKNSHTMNILSYISCYMIKNSLKTIGEGDLRALTAEALREYDKSYDIEKAFLRVKNVFFVRSECENNIYKIKDNNLMMAFTYKYLVSNKIKVRNIINNESFYNYFMWRCQGDAKFTYDNIFEFDDEFLYNMFASIEDKKADNYYPYIKLFLAGKPYPELLRKLNIIYQRFRWNDYVQEMTFKFLKTLNSISGDIEKVMDNRIVAFICENENMHNNYKIIKKRWICESRNSEVIRRVYLNILKADYIEEYKLYRKISKAAAAIEK